MKTERLIAFFGGLLVSAVTQAGPLLESLDYVRFYGSNDPAGWYACENRTGAGCAGSVAVPETNWTLNFKASGTGGYGILKARAEVELTGDASQGEFPSFASVGARTSFRDVYVFHGGNGTGTAQFNFAVDGIADSSGGATARSLFQYVPVIGGYEMWDQQRNFEVRDGVATVTVPFQFNRPTEFIIGFYALAQIWSWEPDSKAVADFSNTAILNQIIVRDERGNLVKDFSVTAESGTDYTATGVVPEPTTALLMLAGILALEGGRRRALLQKRVVSH
ncbi:PEP-CTERM sorting domain-containing protein [Massilia sp. S19_KUP03_FR1]|uniref:PEP-CTERM sorting domain-containing protein n=1 Tax=Massilia sp. S19_KUP03_FR1 TaxID=3025503 RepID=UPI002FCD9990